MSVYTHDVLIEGRRRDEVLDWLARPENHRALVDGAFDLVVERAPGEYELSLATRPRPRTLHYRFDRVDEDHGGRRVHVSTAGRRLDGRLHYSLRTAKPSTNTLVTLHADLDEGGALGALVERLGLRERLDTAFRRILDNLAANLRPRA